MKWMTSRLPLKDGVKRPVSSNFITLCGYKRCRFTKFTGEALGSASSINFVTHLLISREDFASGEVKQVQFGTWCNNVMQCVP